MDIGMDILAQTLAQGLLMTFGGLTHRVPSMIEAELILVGDTLVLRAAALMGVNVNRVRMLTFAMGCGPGGAARHGLKEFP